MGVRSVFPASFANLYVHPKLSESLPGQYLKTNQTGSMWRKHPKSLKSICSVVFIVGIARKFVLKKLFFFKTNIPHPIFREEMINNKAKLYELGEPLPDPHYKWDKKKEAEVEGNSTE